MRKGNATEFYSSLKLLRRMSPEEIKEVPRVLARGAPLKRKLAEGLHSNVVAKKKFPGQQPA